jgi:hypothetical protein
MAASQTPVSNRDASTLHVLNVQSILFKLQELLKAHLIGRRMSVATNDGHAVCADLEWRSLRRLNGLPRRDFAEPLAQEISSQIAQGAALHEGAQLHLADEVVR